MTQENISLIVDLITFHISLQKKLDLALSVHGISFNEYLIIRKLEEAPQKCMRRIDLAEQSGLSASGITRLINPLEKRHIVGKKSVSRDARVSLVELSSAGVELYHDASKTLQSITESILAPLKEKERQQFSALLSELT